MARYLGRLRGTWSGFSYAACYERFSGPVQPAARDPAAGISALLSDPISGKVFEFDVQVIPVPGEPAVVDSRAVEHAFGGHDGFGLRVFVRQVDDFPNAGLNDHFRAFVARKVRNVDRAVVEVGVDLVQDRVEFGRGRCTGTWCRESPPLLPTDTRRQPSSRSAGRYSRCLRFSFSR